MRASDLYPVEAPSGFKDCCEVFFIDTESRTATSADDTSADNTSAADTVADKAGNAAGAELESGVVSGSIEQSS